MSTHRPPRPAGSTRGTHAQSGSMSVALLLMMLGLIGMLGLIEVGYLYWAKRDTQKVADLAALAGAQQLSACAANNQDNTAARGNAQTENGFTQTLTITCGTWDPVANSGITDYFATTASGSTPNAVKVVAQRPVAPFFAMTTSLPNVSAEAVATGLSPVAVFSIGSTLVNVNGAAPLGQLLTGISLPNASLVGYNGLANATITPAGLLNQLGVQVPANITVGGLNSLLASSVSAHALIDVLNAVVNAAGQQQLLSANTTLVNALTTSLGTTPGTVTLGSTSSAPGGLFAQIIAPDSAAQSALNAQVNALQLISTAIGVATGQHALSVSVPPSGISGLSLTGAASVIEPPQIGIGGINTTASTAQVRAFFEAKLDSQGIPLLGGLLTGLQTNITLDIPIAVDLVYAQAKLTSLCSTSSGPPQATFSVNSSVLKTCVGGITQASAFSTAGSCDQIPPSGSTTPLFKVTAAGKTLASLGNPFVITGLSANGTGTLSPGESENIPQNGTSLNIGTTVSNIVAAITTGLLTQSTSSVSSSTISSPLASDLWSASPTTGGNLAQLSAALNSLSGSTSGLQTLLNQTTGQVGTMLGSALTLNVGGLLNGTTGLLTGIGNLLGNLLGQVGCATFGQTACTGVIQNAMSGSTSGTPNSLIALLGFIAQTLQGPLNQLGSSVLTPVLQNTLGVQLGLNTVNLQSLQCHPVQLVY